MISKFYFGLIVFAISFYSHAQNSNEQARQMQQQMQKQMEEIMKHREEMLRSLFNDDSFNDMEKRMQEMMKNFDDGDIDFGAQAFLGGKIAGEYDWKEDDKYKILSLKVKQIKDQPLDIKIEKGQIKIKGEVEEVTKNKKNFKNIKKIQFERVFSIPQGVDEKNPQFDNIDGALLIKFKKKLANTKKPESDRIPITPDKGDVAI